MIVGLIIAVYAVATTEMSVVLAMDPIAAAALASALKGDGSSSRVLDNVERIFSRDRQVTMGPIDKQIGFKAVDAVTLFRKGQGKSQPVFDLIKRLINSIDGVEFEKLQPHDDEFSGDFDELAGCSTVVTAITPSMKAYAIGWAYWPVGPDKIAFIVQAGRIHATIANWVTVQTTSKKSWLSSKTEQKLVEVPTPITPQHWSAIMNLMFEEPKRAALPSMSSLALRPSPKDAEDEGL